MTARRTLPELDITPELVTATVADLPERLRSEALAVASEARAVGWIAFDLLDRLARLQSCTDLLVSRDEYFNTGDLLNEVEKEIGIGTTSDVLAGLSVAIEDMFGGCANRDYLATARQHALDHYREIGKPSIVSKPNEW